MRRPRRDSSYNFWPCLSDLMLATFMFVLLLWLMGHIRGAKLMASMPRATPPAATPEPAPKPEPGVPRDVYDGVKNERDEARRKLDLTKKEVEELRKLLAMTEQTLKQSEAENVLLRGRAKVDLEEAKGFSFNTGTVVLSDNASENFDIAVVKPLQGLLDKYGAYVDALEIIGYTDEQPVARASSDLDKIRPDAVGGVRLDRLRPGSNADLGLLRALAIRERLLAVQLAANGKLLPIRVYSAAHLNRPASGATDPKALRRMEIRLTRLNETPEPQPAGAPQ